LIRGRSGRLWKSNSLRWNGVFSLVGKGRWELKLFYSLKNEVEPPVLPSFSAWIIYCSFRSHHTFLDELLLLSISVTFWPKVEKLHTISGYSFRNNIIVEQNSISLYIWWITKPAFYNYYKLGEILIPMGNRLYLYFPREIWLYIIIGHQPLIWCDSICPTLTRIKKQTPNTIGCKQYQFNNKVLN
jgi:hypothetical protein